MKKKQDDHHRRVSCAFQFIEIQVDIEAEYYRKRGVVRLRPG